MDAISLVMFCIPFLLGAVCSILSLLNFLESDNRNDPANFVGIFFSGLAMVCWWLFALLWPAVATSAMYYAVAYLWMGLGFTFAAITFVQCFLVIRAAINVRKQPTLGIRESREE
jgi:hypothetical protein